jgi:hypothetical protein
MATNNTVGVCDEVEVTMGSPLQGLGPTNETCREKGRLLLGEFDFIPSPISLPVVQSSSGGYICSGYRLCGEAVDAESDLKMISPSFRRGWQDREVCGMFRRSLMMY